MFNYKVVCYMKSILNVFKRKKKIHYKSTPSGQCFLAYLERIRDNPESDYIQCYEDTIIKSCNKLNLSRECVIDTFIKILSDDNIVV